MADLMGSLELELSDHARTALNDGGLSVVIVNYRTSGLVVDCLLALADERKRNVIFDAIVVDGCSSDNSVEELRHAIQHHSLADWVELYPLSFNGGFGWANNQAIARLLARSSPPQLIYLINPDAVIQPGGIASLVQEILRSADVAAAGSLLVNLQDGALGSAFTFPDTATEFFRAASTPVLERLAGRKPLVFASQAVSPVDWVTGASVMFRVEALRDVGLFDEGFFLYFEEVELMLRMRRAGWRVVHVPGSRVRHVGGASTGIGDGAQAPRRLPDYWFRSRRRFFTLAYGPMTAVVASLAWITGLMFWQLRCLLGLGRASAHAPFELRDLLRNGIFPTAADQRVAAPAWDSAPNAQPAWTVSR